MLIKDILFQKRESDKIAIEDGKLKFSYSDLYRKVDIHTQNLKNIISNSKNIGIFLPNSINYILAYFTITSVDGIIIPIDTRLKNDELYSILDYCEISEIITDSSNINNLLQILDGYINRIWVYNLDEKEGFYTNNIINPHEEHVMYEEITEECIAIMLHTSGTTSNPKRVTLTHKNLISNVKSNIESLKLTEKERALIALPMVFGYCNTAQILTHFYLGATIVLFKGTFMPRTFFQHIEQDKITSFVAVPFMLLTIGSYYKRFEYDLSSLNYICFGGGYMPNEALKKLIKEFPGIGFIQTYGQTEASPRVTALLPEDSLRKIGSIGKAIPNVEIKIVDSQADNVKIGEIGEIIVKGPNIMKGYYKNEEATKQVLKGGWLYTGDLGRYDEEGYIYLVGRKKNIIISAGTNVYPEEIEEVILSYPNVRSVKVYSEHSELYGEVIVADLVLEENSQIRIGDLINYCKEKLAIFKIPKKINIVNNFDKTITGKIKRY